MITLEINGDPNYRVITPCDQCSLTNIYLHNCALVRGYEYYCSYMLRPVLSLEDISPELQEFMIVAFGGT